MKSKVTKMVFQRPTEIPIKKYKALWSGYQAIIPEENGEWVLTTKQGIRGINIPAIVTVTDDDITIEIE